LTRIITFGTFDLLHIGHVKIIQRAAALGDELIVGVSSDALNFSKKARKPVYTEVDRMDIVRALKSVDQVFLEVSLELKREYISQFKADVLAMGSDWEGKFDFCKDLCDVVYLPRTENISTSTTKEKIQNWIDL